MVDWIFIIGHRSSKSTFGAHNLDCGNGDDGQNVGGTGQTTLAPPNK